MMFEERERERESENGKRARGGFAFLHCCGGGYFFIYLFIDGGAITF